MMTGTLTDILIVLAVAVVVTLIFSRLRLPALVGLFVAGALIGPNSLALIGSAESVEALAEIGVIFLLFTLGLEFSFGRMRRLARVILIAGPLQVIVTGAIGVGVGRLLGWSTAQSIVLGMLIALSSTAVVIKTLGERGQIDSALGKNALGVLIFQDIVVVPMMLVLPLLAGDESSGEGALSLGPALLVAVAIGLVVLVIVLTRWVVPRVLFEAARSRNSDVFLMAVVTVCFAVAALSARLGLSLALGAFLAGLIISESDYSHQALGYIMPFRNLLMSFFFVSIGMLLEPAFLADYWWMVLLASVGLIVVKTLTGALSVMALGYPLGVSVCTGMSLGQIGEFSFVLAAVATSHALLPGNLQQGFLAVAVITMAMTPIVMARTDRTRRLVDRLHSPSWLSRRTAIAVADRPRHTDHLLIVGFGLNGRNLARLAQEFHFPYAVIDMNPQTVKDETRHDEPLYFGDATNEAVLMEAGAPQARAAAVVIGDPVATRGIVAQLRRVSPCLHIIARTRFVSEVQPLYRLGANDVVPEEFETSVEIFRRTASYFSLPDSEVQSMEEAIRADHYAVLRQADMDTREHREARQRREGAACPTPESLLAVLEDVEKPSDEVDLGAGPSGPVGTG